MPNGIPDRSLDWNDGEKAIDELSTPRWPLNKTISHLSLGSDQGPISDLTLDLLVQSERLVVGGFWR